MHKADSSEEIRKIAMALDRALEGKDTEAVREKLADDCEIELLSVKLSGKEGVRKWFNWVYTHLAKIEFLPVTIMVEGITFFEEYIDKAEFQDDKEARSSQAVVLVFEGCKIKSLRMYFDRIDFASVVAKDIISKTIVSQLVKKSLEGLT